MKKIYSSVCEDVQRHCIAKGYREGDGVNNFIPHDSLAAFGMAKLLSGKFVFTDYPPTQCTSEENLTVLENQRVLLIEDDVISGRTLQLVVDYIGQFKPASMALYLGHNVGIQHLENVPSAIERNQIYIAERSLSQNDWNMLEKAFVEFFANSG